MNWPRLLPRDQGGAPMQEYPAPFVANNRYNSTNAVNSSVISLHPNTSAIEVGAFGGQGVVIRWIPVTETASVSPFASVISSGVGANFDHYVPPSTYRRFVIPKETGGSSQGAAQIGSIAGLYQRLAWANAGATASSILSSES